MGAFVDWIPTVFFILGDKNNRVEGDEQVDGKNRKTHDLNIYTYLLNFTFFKRFSGLVATIDLR